MKYNEFLDRQTFNKNELLAFAHGTLVENPPKGGLASLPSPPFLMFDEITKIERNGRTGSIVAEQYIKQDSWYFQCHFKNDPVQPGCLGVDAIWQLLGFYCCINGAVGAGRALGAGEIDFNGQIRPFDKVVRYELDVRRFSIFKESGAAMSIANGKVFVDDQEIYKVSNARVGTFVNIKYTDYPNPDSPHAKGGLVNKS